MTTIDTLARRYMDAPTADAALWRATARVTDSLHARLLREGFRFSVMSEQPYRNASAMLRDIQRRRLTVSDEGNAHAVWGQDQNLRFRMVHDVLAHGASLSGFTVEGENQAYRAQRAHYPRELWQVLYSEIVAQAALYFAGGNVFGEQRIVTV